MPSWKSTSDEYSYVERELAAHPSQQRVSRVALDRARRSVRGKINSAALIGTLRPSELERIKMRLIRDLIEHPGFQADIDNGHLTFGMIKPHARWPRRQYGLNEDSAAEAIIREIRPPLSTVFQQNALIDIILARLFYENLRDAPTIFRRVTRFMSSGAITGLGLYDPSGDAVQEWRTQIGPTDPSEPDEEGRTDRLRHKFARTIKNNVIHGSDSPETVLTELEYFRQLLIKVLANLE